MLRILSHVRSPILWTSLCLLSACAGPQTASQASVDEAPVREGLNDRFLAEDMSVDQYVQMFELESREIAAKRSDLMAAMNLQPGDDVADVGAGTGLFLAPMSQAVGAPGTVYAVDISTGFVEHLRERAAEEGLDNAEVVLCTEKDVLLPANSVDKVFICDVFHHFTYPTTTMGSIFRSVRPGGELYLVDFERIPGVSREWIIGHVWAGKETFRSLVEEAGFEFVEELDLGMAENYVLKFRR